MEDIADSALRASADVRGVVGRLRRRLREVAADGGGLSPSQMAVFNRLAKDGDSSASVLAAGDRQARAEWLARRLHEEFTEPERQTLIAAAALLERLVVR